MKPLLALLVLTVIAAASALAKCQDCGCTKKCSPTCQCKHDRKPVAP